MTDPKPWLKHYPPGVPPEIDPATYGSLVELIDEGLTKHRDKAAYAFMGQRFSFGQIDLDSRAFGAYLQSLGGEPSVTLATTRADMGRE